MTDPYRFAGRTAVLTGAASGIGEQLAYGLAQRGSHLVLVDVDAERLEPVVARIRAAHPALEVTPLIADLSDRAQATGVAERVLAAHPTIGLLINNAGIALGGRFDQVSVEQFEQVMNVNFRAPMLLIHALLPALTATPGSHIVNMSSLFGLISPYGQSAYSASKFALRGLSQVLRAELAENGVGVTTVHPGGIRTRIAQSALVGTGVPAADREPHQRIFDALLTYPPSKAAEQILNAVTRRKARLLIASSAKLPDLLARLAPVGHARIMQAITNTLTHRSRTPSPAAAVPPSPSSPPTDTRPPAASTAPSSPPSTTPPPSASAAPSSLTTTPSSSGSTDMPVAPAGEPSAEGGR
ncbi:short-subunit dehydrogenase [Paractinoplanes brasiliensis]|uniref:Short-subunit dehydrogenase n=1 Tax=Paractinoplanes brasiliensis TaxID=52695 RepID=A0A4R6J990_9ACTN|nr:SDR family NAD(P)-dependent oxidoreductase [Actinoplanes brasiliensis]TDO32190.1 short-subunit dehydrogenase [Actinoplanes brasiliensis]GID28243.1 short-chain dehydrogenase [Actinoplanes brasiliensis]